MSLKVLGENRRKPNPWRCGEDCEPKPAKKRNDAMTLTPQANLVFNRDLCQAKYT